MVIYRDYFPGGPKTPAGVLIRPDFCHFGVEKEIGRQEKNQEDKNFYPRQKYNVGCVEGSHRESKEAYNLTD